MFTSTYPVDRISRGDASPREPRIDLSPRFGPVPLSPPFIMDIIEFGKSTDIRPPAEVIDDEALHTCRLRGIDHGNVGVQPSGPNNADGRVLTCHCLGETLERVAGFDDGDAIWERCGGLFSGDDGHVKTRLDQGCRDGSAEVARCLCWPLASHLYFDLISVDNRGGRTYADYGDTVDGGHTVE